MPALPIDPETRFWAKVDRSAGRNRCWPWRAHCAWNGYGEFRIGKGRLVKAHRYAWELIVGRVPAGRELDHLCRNRWCVNPLHLEIVTRRVNARRGFCGAHNEKLTRQQKLRIIALRGKVPGAELARRYGVSKAAVSRYQLHWQPYVD